MAIKIFKFKIEYSSLRSKVAQRIFFLFILCALLPLGALAYFSFHQVTKQLYDQANQRLHQLSKTEGMTILERLLFLEADLKAVISNMGVGFPDILASATPDFLEGFKDHFKSFVLITDQAQILTSLGPIPTLPSLSQEEQQYIRAGKTLITVRPNPDNFASIFLVRLLNPMQASQGTLFGEINPKYLWKGEDLLLPTTELFAVDQSYNLLFSTFPEGIPLRELENAIRKDPSSGRFGWIYRNDEYLASYWTLFLQPQFFTEKWILAYAQSKTDILEPLNNFKKLFPFIVLLTFWTVLLLSLSQIRKSLIPIELLREATQKIAAKDFGTRVKIESKDEFEDLGKSFNEMADSLETHMKVMTTINRIGISLSAERNTDRLLEIILLGAKSIINADGAALYVVTEDQKLKLLTLRIDSLNLVMEGTFEEPISLYNEARKPDTRMVAAYSALNDQTINIPDIYTAKGFDFSINRDFDEKTGYRSKSVLTAPMKNHENEMIGVLQLINARDKVSQEIRPFSGEDQHLVESLASQGAVTLTKNKLVEDFKCLFDELIELLATAIDKKSAYTGHHCRRVPILAMMIAEAVCKATDDPFEDVTLSEQELYELKVAALLHDCGKVVTPVHVVDKSTKLETIFDRIHLIDTRFEVLKRDAYISFLHKKLVALGNGNDRDPPALKEELEKTLRQLEEERDFLRNCNVGGEYMPENLRERVRELALKYKWIDPAGKEEPFLSENEVYNLTISKGTLTFEEREIIKQHVVMTAKMLEPLPYPKYLRNVPKFASSHHEYINGMGYPGGLSGDQLPLQARILGIADVFEALTAKDRPYKKAKTLTESLHILGTMKKEGYIDPHLFDLFIHEKVYLRYAKEYLDPEQIDYVMLSEIPGYTPCDSEF
jgi:HD-GYP domain-containing protein (c-di-GMP phosphodiesterase class II)